jgi:hypothetical protein
MDFKITGLPRAEFAPLFELGDAELERAGIVRVTADAPHAFPCRIALKDAVPGEQLLLLTYAHQAARTPYASSGPIFVRCNAGATCIAINEVPDQQRRRLLSVRAYDADHSMTDAEVVPGTELEALIDRFFEDANVSYLHVHNARRGCYACRVDRLTRFRANRVPGVREVTTS